MNEENIKFFSLSFLLKLIIIKTLLYRYSLSLEPEEASNSIKNKYKIINSKKIDYFQGLNTNNTFNLQKILNSFLAESEPHSNKIDYISHKKEYQNQIKDTKKRNKYKKYEIDFNKSFCTIYNYTSYPFLNKGQNIYYNCYLINTYDKKIINISKFISLSNYEFTVLIINNNYQSKNVSKLKKKYKCKIINNITHYSCIFNIKDFGNYSIHAFLKVKNSKIQKEIKSKLNNFYCVPSKLYINNSNILNTYEGKWININSSSITYRHNIKGFITAIDLTTIDGKFSSNYGKIHPNINISDIKVSLFSLHDIKFKFPDLEARLWKYKNKEYIGIFIKQNKNGGSIIIKSSFDYKIKIIFENIVKIITMKMKLNIKKYKTCFHNLDIKKTYINFGNNISLIKNKEIKLGNIELRTEDNYLYNYDIGIKNMKFIVNSSNINFRIISHSIKGIYTVYANSTKNFNGDIKLYIKNKKYKRKLDNKILKIIFENNDIFSKDYYNSYLDLYNIYEFYGETINKKIDFNFYLKDENDTIIDNKTFFDSNNYVDFYLNYSHINSHYEIKYIKNGLFRFIGNLLNKEYPKYILHFNFSNYNSDYDIQYKIYFNLSQLNDVNISFSNSYYSIDDEYNKINKFIYINVTLKDINNKFVGYYSRTLERYKSLILVKAISYFNISKIYTFEFDSLEYNRNSLIYKYNFTEEGIYYINVTFDEHLFTNFTTNIIKLTRSKYTLSLDDCKMKIQLNNSERVINRNSSSTLNNSVDVPQFILSLYNLNKDEIPYNNLIGIQFSSIFGDINNTFIL